MSTKKKTKIVLATRTTIDSFDNCKKTIKKISRNNSIEKIYIICNLHKDTLQINNIKCEILPDINPTRPTAFNLVIDKLNENKKEKFHLLAYSKEVNLQNQNINEMIREVENRNEKIIVAGYSLKDNVLDKKEYQLYTNGDSDKNAGIAYQVPWNTCALWNKEFIYGEGNKRLKFDEICEEDGNQLGKLEIKVDGKILSTPYKGMEDGLAIAELVTKNKGLKYKLIKEKLVWNIDNKEETIKNHKIKMARKNIVLSTFINMKGYSIDKLRLAKITETTS